MPSITFHGAARTVTGSKHLLRVENDTILLDCGLFQGERDLRTLNWAEPLFQPRDIRAVILSHAHLDHVGYLPRLVKLGFRGKIYATPATCDLTKIMLLDAAEIQEEDTRFYRKHNLSRHDDPQPLYDRHDAERALELLTPTPRDNWTRFNGAIQFRYHPAGHLLGAQSIEVAALENGVKSTLLFSGDLGRYHMPYVRDPEDPVRCDYLVMESTYGSRLHAAVDPLKALRDVVLQVVAHNGILLIPAFAVGRSQQLVYMLRTLELRGEIPAIPTHIDSPMALDATEIYCNYPHDHGIPLENLTGDSCVLLGPHFHFHRTREESKQLNKMTGPAVLISSSGMLTGGRVLHHVSRLAPDNKNVILFAGYQAAGTRGRLMLDGVRDIKIYGQNVSVNADVVELAGMSGHGDQAELSKWVFALKGDPQKTFLVHGELESAQALKEHILKQRAWDIAIPEMGETFSW